MIYQAPPPPPPVIVLTIFASFIFRALGQLVDHCLIAYASKYVNGVNAAGVRKIKRNILSLQQTLRGIAAASEQGVLTRASEFWDLYEQGPKVSESFKSGVK